MAEHLVPSVKPAGVSAQKPFHAGDQIRLGCLDHEMKMIRHENISMNLSKRHSELTPFLCGAEVAGRGWELDAALHRRLAIKREFAFYHSLDSVKGNKVWATALESAIQKKTTNGREFTRIWSDVSLCRITARFHHPQLNLPQSDANASRFHWCLFAVEFGS